MMRIYLISVSMVLVGCGACRADFMLSGNWNFTNNSAAAANDFHMSVVHNSSVTAGPSGFFNDGFFNDNTVGFQSLGDNLRMDLDWKRQPPNQFISVGQTIHLGFEYRAGKADPKVTSAYWTQNGVKTEGTQPALPGFKVGSLVLTNSMGAAMRITDLNFRFTSNETPLADLFPYTLPGFETSSGPGTFVPAFDIPDGGEIDLSVFLPLTPPGSNFVAFQFTSAFAATPTLTTQGMFQSSVVPEPSSVALLTIGVILRLLALRVRNNGGCEARADKRPVELR